LAPMASGDMGHQSPGYMDDTAIERIAVTLGGNPRKLLKLSHPHHSVRSSGRA
jgi:hypothetical protein